MNTCKMLSGLQKFSHAHYNGNGSYKGVLALIELKALQADIPQQVLATFRLRFFK